MSVCKFNGKISNVEEKTPFLIGVAGGTASGKSTVCQKIMEKLGQVDVDNAERKVVTISQDSFYRELTPAQKAKALKDAFNDELIFKTLKSILDGEMVTLPTYDYVTNSRTDVMMTIYPADVVLFEGILVFYFPEIRNLFHMKLFVDTDSDTRLARRVPRDINERGRDLDQVLHQYMHYVKPAFEEFCLPTKKHADVIIPRGADNIVAIDLIVHHIWDLLHGPDAHEKLQREHYSLVNADVCAFSVYNVKKAEICYDIPVAIDLIVQHIRDFLNNRAMAESPSHSSRRTGSGDAKIRLH